MFIRRTFAITAADIAPATATGCAVTRDQQSVGSYIDATAITTAMKARFVDERIVDAASISVETLKGTVMRSGFARSAAGKSSAEAVTWQVVGVKVVKSEISARP